MTELVRVARGLWRPAEHLDSLTARLAALLTVCPGDAVFAGHTAGVLHGLWLPDTVSERVDVIVHPSQPPLSRGRNRRAEIRARRQTLRPDEISICHGLPVTTEARTWLDLAACLRLPDLVAAGDSVLRGRTCMSDLAEQIARAGHCPGVVRARAALPLLDARSRSRPESHLRVAIVGSGLPEPAVNEPIYTANGEWLAEPDLSYHDVKLALEYNGEDHAKKDRMRRDLTRSFGVALEHWHSHSFGPVEVFRRPDQVALLVRQLRADRLGPQSMIIS